MTDATRHNRRQFLQRGLAIFGALTLGLDALSCVAQKLPLASHPPSKRIVGGGCDGCESVYEGMPQTLDWQTRIAADTEPGEPMEITGVIYKRDGKTPAPGVILYVYHTDAKGYYSPAPDQPKASRHDGHLRGWMKTNARGEYKFTSIRPAPYPTGELPAHIHPIIIEPDTNEYYIDEYWFDDDPLLTKALRSKMELRGGSGVIHLEKSNGVWKGSRNIILGLNIPGY